MFVKSLPNHSYVRKRVKKHFLRNRNMFLFSKELNASIFFLWNERNISPKLNIWCSALKGSYALRKVMCVLRWWFQELRFWSYAATGQLFGFAPSLFSGLIQSSRAGWQIMVQTEAQREIKWKKAPELSRSQNQRTIASEAGSVSSSDLSLTTLCGGEASLIGQKRKASWNEWVWRRI